MSATAAALRRRVRVLAHVVVAAIAVQLLAAGSSVSVPVGVPAFASEGVVHHRGAAAPQAGEPNDPFYASSPYRWVYTETGLGTVWSRTLGDPSVVVAVVDTGVDGGVPDLRGALLPGWNLDAGTSETPDATGHGTSVASLIGARTDNGVGIAGVCGRCSVLPVRVTGADGSAPVPEIAAGIVWAVDHGARVVNVSLAVRASAAVLASAVGYAQQNGALVVASAGNDGDAAVDYPAGFPGVLSVEAATPNGAPYVFSNHGPSISLAAPGCAVVANAGGGYGSACGTSIAAPLVAGAAALLLAAHPGATAQAVAAALTRGADRIGDTRYGRLDAAKALALLDTSKNAPKRSR